jgi:hypothetical protein
MPVGMTESNKPVGTWNKTCTGTKVSAARDRRQLSFNKVAQLASDLG